MSSHQDRILNQFTRQAEPFSNAAPIIDQGALARIVEATAAGSDDTVLDVACGPGIVVAAFAPHVRHASGIDLTPAMVDRAEQLARERHLSNTEFHVGDVQRLPFADESFSIVVTRLAFHHFEQPAQILAEMRRVCRRGGVVTVVDLFASADPIKARAMNVMERLRDPSHVRALPLAEIEALFPAVDLPPPTTTGYPLDLELESWLARSFPDPRDVPEIRRCFDESLATDALGISARRDGDLIRFTYPVAICTARRPI